MRKRKHLPHPVLLAFCALVIVLASCSSEARPIADRSSRTQSKPVDSESEGIQQPLQKRDQYRDSVDNSPRNTTHPTRNSLNEPTISEGQDSTDAAESEQEHPPISDNETVVAELPPATDTPEAIEWVVEGSPVVVRLETRQHPWRAKSVFLKESPRVTRVLERIQLLESALSIGPRISAERARQLGTPLLGESDEPQKDDTSGSTEQQPAGKNLVPEEKPLPESKPVLVRLEMPPAPLDPLFPSRGRSLAISEPPIDLIATYAWCDKNKGTFASEWHTVREDTLNAASASGYFPLEAGRQWVYRRTFRDRLQVRDKDAADNNIVKTETRRPFYWRSGVLSDGAVVEERGCMKIVLDVLQGDDAEPNAWGVDEFTLVVGKPVERDGEVSYPIMAFPDEGVRDGRYGSRSFCPTWWTKIRGKAGDEFHEVTLWTSPPPSSEQVTCRRPLLFDAGYSMVKGYGTVDEPSKEARHGMIVELDESPAEVPAGEYRNTLRFVEYLEPRGQGASGLTSPTDADNQIDCGWVTVSWYAKGVGLVKEVQYLRDGSPYYELELVSTQTDRDFQTKRTTD